MKPEHAEQIKDFRGQLLALIPKSNPAAKPVAELSAAEWKDTFFKTHPNADANGDGTLSWPEYKVYKAKLDAGEVAKPTGNPKAPAAAGRLQTSGTFSKTDEGGIIFTDQAGGQVYYVIKELAGSVEPHWDKPVKIVANVKDSTKSKAKVMVYLVSIQAEETGKPQPKAFRYSLPGVEMPWDVYDEDFGMSAADARKRLNGIRKDDPLFEEIAAAHRSRKGRKGKAN